jgi:hypothetical protein
LTDDIVPDEPTVCDDVSNPALTMVRKSPVTAIAITAPVDILCSFVVSFSPDVSNPKSQVLINVFVY